MYKMLAVEVCSARPKQRDMRHLVALMLVLATAAGRGELDGSVYSSAGSEDIYFQQPNQDENGSSYSYNYYDEDDEEQPEEPELEEEQAAKPPGDNIEGIGENEISCEFSCPRYYRPVCVRRNGELITYATPCEYHNRLRCANVARRLGHTDTPTYELVYYNACR